MSGRAGLPGDASNALASAAASLATPTAASSAPTPETVGQTPAGPAEAWGPVVGVVLTGLNHVLGQHAWARDRLSPFAGQSLRTVLETPLGPMAAGATIRPDGMLEAAPAGVAPTVTLSVRAPLDALVAVAGAGTSGAMRHVRIDGDAALAAAVGQVVPHLRWDAEDDLARVVGDVAARRAVRFLERLRDGARDMRARAESAAVAHLVYEDPQLVSRPMLDGLRTSVRTLRDDLERLDKRIERLQRR